LDLVFVRHAQPEWEPDGRAVDDPSLSELGRAQAQRLAEELAKERFDALYVSPLRRALETAEPIGARLSVESKVESWLREIGLPALEGWPREAVQRFFEEARARDLERWWDGPPDGESFRHFQERVISGIEGLLLDGHRIRVHEEGPHRLWGVPESGRRLLLVSHAGTIAVTLSHLLGIPQVPWAAERFLVGWAGVARLRPMRVARGAVWCLASLNARGHLAGLPDPEG
jgi:broad specificity phosphatase PhoE